MRSMPINWLCGQTSHWLRYGVLATLLASLLTVDTYAGRRSGLLKRLFNRRCCSEANTGSKAPADVAPESPAAPQDDADPQRSSPSDLPATSAWRPLFNGKSLDGWQSTSFGGEGEVYVEDGMIIMEMGNSLTGVHYKGELPVTNYEVEYEGMRLSGIDFFSGITFPVNGSYCSFIAGGWAGGIVGLSSIDGLDASENETTKYMTFDNNRWYRFRVQVRPESIAVWIDDQNIVYQNISDRRISTRAEVDPSRPFGFSAWQTRGAIRNIRLRTLPPESAGDDS